MKNKIVLMSVAVLLSPAFAAAAPAAAPLSLGEAAEDLADTCSSGKTAEARRLMAAAEAALLRLPAPAEAGGRSGMDLALADDLLGRARELCARGASPTGALAANQLMLVALELEPPADALTARLVWFDYLAMDIVLRSGRPGPYDRAVVERRALSIVSLWAVLRPGFASHAKLVADGDALAAELGRPAKAEVRARQGAKAADFVDELETAK